MSGMMAKFIANLLPYFAFLWSLNLLLFNRTLYDEFYESDPRRKLIIPYITIGVASFFIVFPVRSLINACSNQDANSGSTNEKYDDF